MMRLIPEGFLSIRQAAHWLATAMYSGAPDRPPVAHLKSGGFDVADGEAIPDAVSQLWKAYDSDKLEAFLIGAAQKVPLKLTSDMSKEIPGLRSARGGGFTLLRHRNHHHHQLVEWFGRDLSTVVVVFRETEIKRLGRELLQRRRRRTKVLGKKGGRPPVQLEVQSIIRRIVDRGTWNSTQSIKSLALRVNREGKLARPVSEDTVERALRNLHQETHDRRYQRVEKKRRRSPAASAA
jgi:hypothetical protein